MLQALLAGVASIKAQQTRMNVIGNNLANVNTAAYKGGRVTFQDMLAQTIRGAARPTANIGGTNPIQYGLGVLIAGTDINNEQGSLNATNRPTDIAIQGNGYFMVSNGQRLAYTRDGGFDLDANGDLVHRATGERVVGWNFIQQANTSTGVVLTPATTLNIPLGRLNASRVTSYVEYQGNLDGGAPAGLAAGDPANWRTSMRVFDSLGGAHNITIEFYNRTDLPGPPPAAVSEYSWRALDEAGNPLTITGPPLQFDNAGRMTNPADPNNAASLREVTVQVPTGTGGPMDFDVQLDFNSVRQLKTSSQVNASNQDGFPPGELQAFSVNQDGLITGLFTNGLTQDLGQMALSIFPNPGGLERTGNNLWRNTDNSGVPVVGPPRTGGRGTINAGYLEQSNVDIGAEFTDLIVTQRGFQANTRVVTTVDEMLQDLINMKR
ncbi:MAG TPA: flagellar hook protein FlgE [Fimbriimonadaceae bacterium]|nr:flagellar hook protein FlgE [Fimbriimonadaceae bacterium]